MAVAIFEVSVDELVGELKIAEAKLAESGTLAGRKGRYLVKKYSHEIEELKSLISENS